MPPSRDLEAAAVHFTAAREHPVDATYAGLYATNRAFLAIVQFCLGKMESALALAHDSFSTDLSVPYQLSRPIALVALAADGDLNTARQALRSYSASAHSTDFPYADESVSILGGVLAALEDDWDTRRGFSPPVRKPVSRPGELAALLHLSGQGS